MKEIEAVIYGQLILVIYMACAISHMKEIEAVSYGQLNLVIYMNCTVLVTSLAGGGYVRCFNAVSGSLHWENSVAMAQPDTHSTIELLDSCKYFYSLTTVSDFILY